MHICIIGLVLSCIYAESAGSSTNGTEFMFSTPQLFKTQWDYGLNVMTFQLPNELTSEFYWNKISVQKYIYALIKSEAYIKLGSNYDSPVEFGDKPTIYVSTVAPVHLVLWLVRNQNEMSAMVKLLPTDVWGTIYYAVTLKWNPTLLITASVDDTKVRVHLRISEPYDIHIIKDEFSNRTYRLLTFELDRLQSYSVSYCRANATSEVGSYTGSKIEATDPVGVITGSCFARTNAYKCNLAQIVESPNEDILLENGLPKKYLGTEYISFPTNAHQQPFKSYNGEIIVVASDPGTVVEIASNAAFKRTLQYEGDWIHIHNREPQVVSTSRPATVYLLTWSHCEGDPDGMNMPSISVLVPSALFFNFYTMRKIALSMKVDLYFVAIYRAVESIFVMDGKFVHYATFTRRVQGGDLWQVGLFQVESALSTLHMRDWANFGCYVLQLFNKFGSVTFADFKVSEINPFLRNFTRSPHNATTIAAPTIPGASAPAVTTANWSIPMTMESPVRDKTTPGATPETMPGTLPGTTPGKDTEAPLTQPPGNKTEDEDSEEGVTLTSTPEVAGGCTKTLIVHPNDTLDNDCDGKVDEEPLDYEDNDNDGAEDEDVYTVPVDGDWATWNEWLCTENCSNSEMSRRRLCDDPAPEYGGKGCVGIELQFKPGDCYKENGSCPTNCDENVWYEGCTRECLDCKGDCNKFNGSCVVCMPGYRNPNRGCRQACDSHSYGQDCSFSCKEKCGTICAEPVNGECPEDSMVPLLLMCLFVVIPFSMLICMPKQKHRHGIDSEYNQTVTQSSMPLSGNETGTTDSQSGSAGSRVSVEEQTQEGPPSALAAPQQEVAGPGQESFLQSFFGGHKPRKGVLQPQYHHYHHNRHHHIGSQPKAHKKKLLPQPPNPGELEEGTTVDPNKKSQDPIPFT